MSFYFLNNTRNPHETLPLNAQLWTSHAPDDGRCIAFQLHNHESLEINLILKGKMLMNVDGRKYTAQPGDAVLANPFALHTGECVSHDPDVAYICFTAVLSKLLNYSHSPLMACCRDLETGKYCFDEFYPAGESRVSEIICELQKIYTSNSNENECRSLMLTFELLSLLFGNHYHPTPELQHGRKNIEFSKSVSLFVQDHYHQDITTSDAAEALHMELSQFCRTFKREFGVSFLNHLCKYRCVRAAELYNGSDLAVSEIAAAVGFSDYCYFSHSFKKYIGQSPAKYFGKWH